MICIRCGAEFDDNTVFCPECGAAVIIDDDKTVAVPFDEMTQRAKNDVSSDSDATTVADYDESTAVDDSTLLGDDKAFVSPEIKKSKRSPGEGKDKKSTVIAVVAIVAVLLVALAAVLLLFKSKSGEDAATTAATTAPVTEQEIPEDVVVIEVPALDGKTLQEAEQILNGNGITYEIVETYSDDVESGKVVSQFPESGSQVTPGTLVHITVSIGKEEIGAGQSGNQAQQSVIKAEYADISPSDLTLMPGQTAKINVKIYPDNATSKEYILISDNYIVASIGDGNTVMAVSSGSATISVLAPDGTFLGEMSVSVREPEAPSPVTQAPTQAPQQNKPTNAPTQAPTQPPKYKVSLDANGGSVSRASITVEKNGTYEGLPNPTRNGYTFDGWKTSGGATVTASSDIAYNYDHTLKAQWTAKAYTSWSTSAPPSNIPSSNIKTRTVYSYRDKETTTSNSKLSGDWVLEKTTSTLGDYGAWSSWSKTKPANAEGRAIETKTVTDKAAYTEYTYGRWVHSCSCSGKYTALQYCTNGHSGTFKTLKTTSPLKLRKDESWGAQYLSDGQLWFIVDNYSGSNYGGSKKIPAVTHTEYRYRDRATVYTYHYYRWSDWSSWSTTSYSKSATREVKTQTQYCYRPN